MQDKMSENEDYCRELEQKYQFPEVLSEEELESILKKFTVLERSDKKCREEMLSMFNRFVLPLPQRSQLRRLQHLRTPKEILKHVKESMSMPTRKGEHSKEKDSMVCKESNIDKEQYKNIIKTTPIKNNAMKRPVKLKRKFNKDVSSHHSKEKDLHIQEVKKTKKVSYETNKEFQDEADKEVSVTSSTSSIRKEPIDISKNHKRESSFSENQCKEKHLKLC